MESKFEVFNLLSKMYAGNTTNKERKMAETRLNEMGKTRIMIMAMVI